MTDTDTDYSKLGVDSLDYLDETAQNGSAEAGFQAWWLRVGSRIQEPVRQQDNLNWSWYTDLCLIAWANISSDHKAFWIWLRENDPFHGYYHGKDTVRNLIKKAYLAAWELDERKGA